MFPFGVHGPKRNSNGIGYAGDARGDAEKRKKLKKQAHANAGNETAIQEVTLRAGLQSFSLQSSVAAEVQRLPSSEWFSTLKSVLRNQAGWSSDRKCTLYQLALDCCDCILQQSPEQLGDEDDSESLIVALLEMVSTAQVVSKHSLDFSRKVRVLAERVLDMKNLALQISRAVIEKEDLVVVDNHDHYRHTLRPFAFDFVDRLQGHFFEKQRSTSSAQSTKQRQRVLRELGTYKTALPVEYGSSIFVRAVESRMDLLRCLIIGPDGSPYENGCFFFDIHLAGYPTSPPKVKFLTTGNGKYRFNPNLYKDGKVCLSLLGTWSGPGWQSGESTLLQVLVSIQSLILVEQPYFNEPGFQASEGTLQGTSESNRYNESVRCFTLDAAILPHLQRLTGATASMYPEFDVVIEKHFELKEHALKTQLSQWRKHRAQESPHTRFPSYMNLHQSKACCPTMETLYISCVAAIDSWPRKQKARQHRNNASTASSSVSLEGSINETVAAQCIHAVEVNGVIEIDLGDEIEDASATSSLYQRNSELAVAMTSRPLVNQCSGLKNPPTEVIDLT